MDLLISTVLNVYADVAYEFLKRLRISASPRGISIELAKPSSIDERIAKIDEAKASLVEGIKLIEELREAAETNKKESELALQHLAKLEGDRANLQHQLEAMKIIAESDVSAFRKMVGVPSPIDIRKERAIAFFVGVISSLVASGIFLGIARLIEQATATTK